MSDPAAKKRKRADTTPTSSGKTTGKSSKKVKAVKTAAPEEDAQAQILLLESQILESKKHYNNIATLLELCQKKAAKDGANITASVALCRVFCRLMIAERMIKKQGMNEADLEAVDWLKDAFRQYVAVLCSLLAVDELQSTSLTLLMRLVKEESQQEGQRAEQAWRSGVFSTLVRALVEEDGADAARDEFVEKFVEEHDDVRYFTFYHIANVLSRSNSSTQSNRPVLVANSLSLLTLIEGTPDSDDQLEDWYGQEPKSRGKKHTLLKVSEHRKIAQEAWLSMLRSALTKEQRKTILTQLTTRIVPWFSKIETLMDFLTDSYNAGGASSLLALSGLFYLMTEKNLDYPAFYNKLYSLLDDSLLHSKHRSRFFRLLNTFLSSTHLPAAMVASFIKRLSRLALHAPPGAIVVVVPWIYNTLKKHPTCTFMIHRVPAQHFLPPALKKIEDEGMDDPFDMTVSDPMETGAIDSSLWELETLASHYHPNVATLARIVQEQFTKHRYELEDFLDHTYDALIDGELDRALKKAPVVEYEIPKRIFTKDEGSLDALGTLLQAAVDAN